MAELFLKYPLFYFNRQMHCLLWSVFLKRQQGLSLLPHFFNLCSSPHFENKGPGPLGLKLVGVLCKIISDFMYSRGVALISVILQRCLACAEKRPFHRTLQEKSLWSLVWTLTWWWRTLPVSKWLDLSLEKRRFDEKISWAHRANKTHVSSCYRGRARGAFPTHP